MHTALRVSVACNILLVGALVAVLTKSSGAPATGTSSAQGTVDHLLLQVQCGKGDTAACTEVERRDREACDRGGGEACVLLGIGKQVGKQVPKDPEGAVLFEKACDLRDGAGCWYAGSCYEYGRGRPKDEAQALALYRRACTFDHDNGCLSLGEALERAKPPDAVGALAAYDHGCRLHYDSACTRAARLRDAGR